MGIFHRSPYFGYNSAEHEIPLLYIFTFQRPSGTQINWQRLFMAWIFSHEKQLERNKYESGPPGLKWAQVARDLVLAVPPCLVWPSFLRCRSSLLHIAQVDLKVLYKDPRSVLARRQRRNMKLRNSGYSSEDWRGKCCQSCPRSLLQPLQHHQHRHHDEEGLVHLWTMVFGSILFYLSLVLWCLDATWPRAPWAPPLPLGETHLHHYAHHLFIIPTVISWQTRCLMQYIIFSWSIVSLCLVLSDYLFIAMVI
jgi:hypothetical protein